MCAFSVIQLGSIIEANERKTGMVVELEPQGQLFAEVIKSAGFILWVVKDMIINQMDLDIWVVKGMRSVSYFFLI